MASTTTTELLQTTTAAFTNTTSAYGQWQVYNTITLIIAAAGTFGIAGVLILAFIGAKRRLMAVKNEFVPILSQSISARQKAKIIDEQTIEASFDMRPAWPPGQAIHGWYVVDASEGAPPDPVAALLQRLDDDTQRAFASLDGGANRDRAEPRVVPYMQSAHRNEYHLATLVARSYKVVEAHATALSSALARDKNQEVSAYIRNLQSTLHLDKRVCDRFTNAYLRARWSGPVGSAWTIDEFLQFEANLRELLASIDSSA